MHAATLFAGESPVWRGRSRFSGGHAWALSQRTFSIRWQASTPTASVPQANVEATASAGRATATIATARLGRIPAIYYLRDLSGKSSSPRPLLDEKRERETEGG